MRINLDLDVLRTLVVAHDRGGLSHAAEHLGRTPSAMSLQMKRLQEDLGTPIFGRRGRGLALTEAGETALAYARRILALNDELVDTTRGANLAGHIRIGCPQDFAWMLPSVLAHFSSLYPRLQIELHVEGNASLLEAVSKARLDLAIIIGHHDHASARIAGQLELVWIASSTFSPPDNQPMPLAMLDPPCAFRKRATEHLEAASMRYRIAANSPSLDGLWAALLGGLGVTARTALNLPDGLLSSRTLYRLPALGDLLVTVHRNAQSHGVSVDRMETLLTRSLELILQPNPRTKAVGHPSGDAADRTGKT